MEVTLGLRGQGDQEPGVLLLVHKTPKAGLPLVPGHVAAVHPCHEVVGASLLPVAEALDIRRLEVKFHHILIVLAVNKICN